MISQWLELLMTGTIFYGPKDVTAIQVLLCIHFTSNAQNILTILWVLFD